MIIDDMIFVRKVYSFRIQMQDSPIARHLGLIPVAIKQWSLGIIGQHRSNAFDLVLTEIQAMNSERIGLISRACAFRHHVNKQAIDTFAVPGHPGLLKLLVRNKWIGSVSSLASKPDSQAIRRPKNQKCAN